MHTAFAGNPASRLGRLLKRFARTGDGATAVEFALVALPFFAMLFAILQTALVFFASQVFETAVAEASRKIMTGQITSGSTDLAGFKTEICNNLDALFDCENGVSVDVTATDSFDGANPGPVPIKNGKVNSSGFVFEPGNGGSIVTVRAVYQWPIFMSLMNPGLADVGSTRLLVATAVFQNEPFKSSGS
ncbi:MAG TPA: TadE/TadG family type IV pilus assembly protein [Hyphomicrobiales bacterium]|nr:TadE/TadG family type IV pilus assembly protein [Hyphomicrobiales bacterium]